MGLSFQFIEESLDGGMHDCRIVAVWTFSDEGVFAGSHPAFGHPLPEGEGPRENMRQGSKGKALSVTALLSFVAFAAEMGTIVSFVLRKRQRL